MQNRNNSDVSRHFKKKFKGEEPKIYTQSFHVAKYDHKTSKQQSWIKNWMLLFYDLCREYFQVM